MTTIICMILGGLIGFLYSVLRRRSEKRKSMETDGSYNNASLKKLDILRIVLLAAVPAIAINLYNTIPFGESNEKTFSKAGMTITLNESFQEKEHSDFTVLFQSKRTMVMAYKEEFAVLEDLEIPLDISLRDYAEQIAANNNINSIVKETDGLTCFEYELTVDGKDYYYLVVFYRGQDAYWTVNYVCETKRYSEYSPLFFKWANSVVV